MDSLEIWIQNLVEMPADVLSSRYLGLRSATNELEALLLPKKNGHTMASSTVSEVTLENLHSKIRGLSCEDRIWDAVIWLLVHPLPLLLAHDLIDRYVSVVLMAFTRQVDEIQWRLATIVEDALYTLISERYQLPEYSVEQFETMLRIYTIRDSGVLYMLTFRQASSPEKEAVYREAVERKEEWLREQEEKEEEEEEPQ